MGKMFDNVRAWWNSLSDAFSDPSKLAALSVADLEKNIAAAKEAAASVIGRPVVLKEKLSSLQSQDEELTKRITTLVASGEEGIEAAKKHVQKQVDVRKMISSLSEDLEDAQAASEQWKSKISMLESELSKRRNKAADLSADYAAAKAEQTLGKQFSDINIGTGEDTFSKLEERVFREKAKAAGYTAMSGMDDTLKEEKIISDAETQSLLDEYLKK